MTDTWDEARLKSLLGESETLTLEFKESRFLETVDPETGKADKKKRSFRISKHVSAMANAAGGVIIFGIQEKNKVADSITPINELDFSKEQLQQIIDHNIQPKIDGLMIHRVVLNQANYEVAYIVEIPRSSTAHQANDFIHYQRRSGPTTEKMNASEIRDVMGREQHPKIELEFEILHKPRHKLLMKGNDPQDLITDIWVLRVNAVNVGKIFARFVYCRLHLSTILETDEERKSNAHIYERDERGKTFYIIDFDNGHLVDVETGIIISNVYRPILPNLSLLIGEKEIGARHIGMFASFDTATIEWEVSADNAPLNKNSILINKIPIRNE